MSKDAEVISVFGPRGSGKSTLTIQLIEKRQSVVAFDPLDEYSGLRGWTRVELGFNRDLNMKRLSQAALQAGKRQKFRLAVVPTSGFEKEALEHLCMWLFLLHRRYKSGKLSEKITLVAEELHLSFPSRQMPKEFLHMALMCSVGRHWGLEVIGVTQFPQQVSTTFKNNSLTTYAFRMQGRARKYVEEELPGEDIARFRKLARYEFVQNSIDGVRWGKTLKSGKVAFSKG